MKTRAVVVSVGARTPIGLQAPSTGFAHRAAAAAMQQSPLLDGDDEPATMCLVPTIDPLSIGAARAAELARPALEEALEPLGSLTAELRFELLVCVDEHLAERRANERPAASFLVEDITRRASALLPQLEVSSSTRGPAALGFAFEALVEKLKRGEADAALIGGVHTDYDPARIAALSAAKRLFTPNNLDAMIPGECAAFAVLMRPDTARAKRLPSRVEIQAIGTGHERARPDNDEPAFEAFGLTAAVRQAGEPLAADGLGAGWMLTDLSFETLRVFELQAMMARTQKLWCEPQVCDAPAQRMGYLGAAAMPLELVLAAEGWRRGWAPHHVAMALAGSDAGERAAMLLGAPR